HTGLARLPAAVEEAHLWLRNLVVRHGCLDRAAEELGLAQAAFSGGALDLVLQVVREIQRCLYHTCMVNDAILHRQHISTPVVGWRYAAFDHPRRGPECRDQEGRRD